MESVIRLNHRKECYNLNPSDKEVSDMAIEIRDEETKVIKHALEVYLSNLRGEIVKTEKREWKEGLHKEEDLIKEVLARFE